MNPDGSRILPNYFSAIYSTDEGVSQDMSTIYSWNVNGIRAISGRGFLDWLIASKADVVCLQETKASEDVLSEDIRCPNGYESAWFTAKRKGYSGVGAYYKARKKPLSISGLGVPEFDDEGRVMILEYPDYEIINCYFPNSQPERARLDYKLAFNDAIRKYCNKRVKAGQNVIVCGDLNVAHKDIDIARPKSNRDKTPGFYTEECESMTKFLDAGYVDTFRHFCDESDQYSWWSFRGGAREKNVGWRLDYHVINKGLLPRLKSAKIHQDVVGSDHCPVSITLK